jgi:hypothetical protein
MSVPSKAGYVVTAVLAVLGTVACGAFVWLAVANSPRLPKAVDGHLIYLSVDEVPAGTYTVSCTGGDPGVEIAASPRISLGLFVGAIFGAFASAGAFGVAAAIVLTVTLVRRNRARRPPGSVTATGL